MMTRNSFPKQMTPAMKRPVKKAGKGKKAQLPRNIRRGC